MRSRVLPADECSRAREWASLRLDSQLSDFEEALLQAHLQRCVDCRAFAEAATQVTEILRTAPLEEPTFALQLPRRRRVSAYGLRAASAAAAVAAVGLSGLVSLQLSTSRVPAVATSADRALIGLKELQMDELDGTTLKASRKIRPGLAAAEQVTIGTSRAAAVGRQSPKTAVRRFPLNG